MRRLRLLWLLGILAVCAAAGGIAVAASSPGEVGPATGMTGNGRLLHPVGRLTTVGDFPTGSALTPDGRFLWVTDCGHGSDDVDVVNVATGTVVQTLPLPGCYGGIAFTRDGTRAYVDGEPQGSSPTEGAVKGAGGDVIHVFTVNPADGLGTEGAPITLTTTSGGSGRTNSLPPPSSAGSAYPEGLAISPDGTKLVVALNQADKAVVIDLRTLAQTAVATGAYPEGVVFDHQGFAYVSNEYDGTVTVIDPIKGSVVTTISGLGGARGDLGSHLEGMASDPVRNHIYVAVTNRDLVATVDTTSRKVVTLTSVARPEALGTAPVKLTVAPDGQTLYVADSGEDAIAAISLSTRPKPRTPVIPRRLSRPASAVMIAKALRLERQALRAERRVTRLRHASKARKRLAVRRYHGALAHIRGRYLHIQIFHACGGMTVAQSRAYIAAVIKADTTARRKLRRRRLAAAQRRLIRITPCPAPGYIPNLPEMTLIGRLPTAAYPTDVQVTPDGSTLMWLAGKGLGSGPNPNYPFQGDKRVGATPSNIYGTYVLDQLLGRVGVLPIPSDEQMRRSTALADAEVVPADHEAAPVGSPVPAPGHGPSTKITHVFYIVRENRTYDQVFGSDPRGDGAASLELFDDTGVAGPTGGITPNAHALARQFPLLDHFYADSEVSVDGHIITAGGYATDYVQKALAANYSNRNRAYDFGIFPVTNPPNDYVFDQAVKQGVSFRDYGEAVGASPSDNAANRTTYSGVAANVDAQYPNDVFIGCLQAGVRATCTQDSGLLKGTGKPIAPQSRFDSWYPEFEQRVAAGTVPTLNYMILPNDHTNGTTTGDFTPQAMIADNDLALGQIVDAISHSSIWPSTAIFVVEDDSQDGADHVDSHRMPALVISPWAQHGAVVHTRLDQYSMLRTVELIAGIDPLSLDDALATPMYDAFVSGATPPDDTPYNVVAPTQDIGETNGSSAPLALASDRLPWNHLDAVPQEISDHVLWASVRGLHSTPPAPGPDASPVEHARAVSVRRMLAKGIDVRRYFNWSITDR